MHPSQVFAQDPAAFAADHPVFVAAAFTIATDEQLRWLGAFADAGGHLVVGIRTGYEDQESRARVERKPAFLTEASGIRYDEFSNLHAPVRVTGDGALTVPPGAQATRWIDGVHVDDADVLASYDHPHFGRFAAVTTRVHGSGRVTYVGTVPSIDLARAVMDWAVEQGTGTPSWRPDTDSQTVSSSVNRHGETVHVVHNWSWEPSTFRLPTAAEDVLDGTAHEQGTAVELGSWDVRVFAVASSGSVA